MDVCCVCVCKWEGRVGRVRAVWWACLPVNDGYYWGHEHAGRSSGEKVGAEAQA